MNKSQKWVAIIFAIILVVLLLFPPYLFNIQEQLDMLNHKHLELHNPQEEIV